jgi:hypothetical protein
LLLARFLGLVALGVIISAFAATAITAAARFLVTFSGGGPIETGVVGEFDSGGSSFFSFDGFELKKFSLCYWQANSN